MHPGVFGFIGGARGEPEGLADFEAPGAALDGFVGGELCEETTHLAFFFLLLLMGLNDG